MEIEAEKSCILNETAAGAENVVYGTRDVVGDEHGQEVLNAFRRQEQDHQSEQEKE